ncbi:MAG: ribokinase, partial [Acidimicrobiia bacterium]|nr:ribokinase [Acidimicrobiia bacterium]
MARIAVVGSLNLDVVMMVSAFPSPGETVLASRHFTNPGGKGANQAVAAARLGNQVSMIGAVGSDSEGRRLVEALKADGVDTAHVLRLDAATGMAAIAVDANAENTIAVGQGANGAITADDLDPAADVIAAADVVLMQLEIPLDVVERTAELARGLVILNPAPAQVLPNALLDRIGVLVPNQHELAVLVGSEGQTRDLVPQLSGPTDVVVTLGSEGAF